VRTEGPLRTPEPRPYLMGDTVADRAQYASDMAEWADRPQEYETAPWTRDDWARHVARRLVTEYGDALRVPVIAELRRLYGPQALRDALPVLRAMAADEYRMERAFRLAKERINWIIQEVGE
jgi:hypothetical protein